MVVAVVAVTVAVVAVTRAVDNEDALAEAVGRGRFRGRPIGRWAEYTHIVPSRRQR